MEDRKEVKVEGRIQITVGNVYIDLSYEEAFELNRFLNNLLNPYGKPAFQTVAEKDALLTHELIKKLEEEKAQLKRDLTREKAKAGSIFNNPTFDDLKKELEENKKKLEDLSCPHCRNGTFHIGCINSTPKNHK